MSGTDTSSVVRLDEVIAARERIGPRVKHTPTVTATTLGELTGVELLVKAELLQKTGSFKVRGVFNSLLLLDAEQHARGVVSLSAGNHAAALAYGARETGTSAVIVMPVRASAAKVAATQAYGGEVVLTERPLLEVTHEVMRDRTLTLVHPFDSPHIIAGAGSVGLELVDDTAELDAVLVPVGGGGLISGVAVAVKALSPSTRVIGVEPTQADAVTQALAAGSPVTLDHPQSIADGLTAPFAGVHTLSHIQRHVDAVVTVSEDDIAAAVGLVYQRTKFAVEPAAAAPIAALLSGVTGVSPGARVAVILSGGNIDGATLARMVGP